MTLGQRIQEGRKRLGLSQEALGERCGVTRQAISKWESDGTIPEVDKLVMLGRLFGVSVGALLGVEAEGAQTAAETEAAPPARKRLWPWLAAGGTAVLLLAGLVVLAVLVGRMQSRLDGLQDQLASVSARAQAQPVQQVDITAQIKAALAEQNDLLAESVCTVTDVDLDAQTVSLALSATPRRYVDGMTLAFTAAGPELDSVTVPGALGAGQIFTAVLICPLADEIRLSAVLTEGEERFSASMETLYDTKRQYTMQISAHWSQEDEQVVVEVAFEVGSLAMELGYPVEGEVRVIRNGVVEGSKPVPLGFTEQSGDGQSAPVWAGGPTWSYVYFDDGYPEGAELEVFIKDSAGREYTVPVTRE